MPYANGLATISIEIEPSDGTTLVAVTVDGPDGTALTPTPISTDGGQNWVASFVPTVAGEWIATWTIDGTGEGVAPQKVYVTRQPTAAEIVDWRPELEDVAAYVPSATLVGAVDGYGNPVQTFRDGPATGDGQATHPTASAVQRLITDACAWVSAATGDLANALTDSARGLAARRAAGWAQYTWVDDADDRAHAERLLASTDAELKQLAARNTALTGDAPVTTTDETLPVWYFPPATELIL